MIKCKTWIEYRDHFRNPVYDTCDRQAKYKCEYKNVHGVIETQNVCGIHFASLKKWNEKMNKKYKFDPCLTFEKINP